MRADAYDARSNAAVAAQFSFFHEEVNPALRPCEFAAAFGKQPLAASASLQFAEDAVKPP